MWVSVYNAQISNIYPLFIPIYLQYSMEQFRQAWHPADGNGYVVTSLLNFYGFSHIHTGFIMYSRTVPRPCFPGPFRIAPIACPCSMLVAPPRKVAFWWKRSGIKMWSRVNMSLLTRFGVRALLYFSCCCCWWRGWLL